MIIWNPWHGCHKISEGCEHCYMYFLDRKRGIDTSRVYRTESFDMPLQKKRDGSYKYPSGMEMYVGLSTDFFVQEADAWRDEAWRIIKERYHRESKNHIPNKQLQSKQAYLSGLSFQGKPINYKLRLPEGNLFGQEIQKPKPFFREHCQTCGSRMCCNGCS